MEESAKRYGFGERNFLNLKQRSLEANRRRRLKQNVLNFSAHNGDVVFNCVLFGVRGVSASRTACSHRDSRPKNPESAGVGVGCES